MSYFPLEHLTDEQRKRAHEVLLKYSDSVISYSKDDTTEIQNYVYRPVLSSYEPFFGKPYRLADEADRACAAIIESMLERGIIAPIRFPQAVHSIFVVRKNSQAKMEADTLKNMGKEVNAVRTPEEEKAWLRKNYRLIMDMRPTNNNTMPPK